MRGQVIDGLYKGCTAEQLENDTFCIRDPQGQSILVTQDTAQGVTDISHNYPGFGARTYMVRWKQDAVSVLQLFPDQRGPETHHDDPVPPGKSRLPLILAIAAVLLCGALAAAWFTGLLHRHHWTEATCAAPRTCTGCGETEGKPRSHTPGEWTVLKKGSYGSWGTQVQSCVDCGGELAQRKFLPDAHTGSMYVCSTDEFLQRLDLWLGEAGLTRNTILTDEDGEMVSIQVKEGGSVQAVICFVDGDDTIIMGEVPGRLNASSVCIAFDEGSSLLEEQLMPPIVACCGNGLDLTSAGELAARIRSAGKLEQDGVRYLWGSVDGLDYLFLGFDGVPDSLQNLPAMDSSGPDAAEETGSILYYNNGSKRNAADFADAYLDRAAVLSEEYGYGTLQCDYLDSFSSFSYAIRKQGAPDYTVLAFARDQDLITANGAFDEIYMLCSTKDDAQVDAFAFHSAAMVHLVDPTLGDLSDCAGFLDEMTEAMDEDNKSIREVNGITYYFRLRDDGYISLVISF